VDNKTYPTNAEVKRDILEAGRRLYQRGFVAANDGNLSARVSDRHIWATPTGVSKGFMTEEMLVKLDLEGNVIEGTHRPSSEIKMHLRIYREAPDILAVAHAHPPVAASFAAAGIPLDKALLQEAVVLLGVIPVAPYALPGSDALAESVVPYLKEYNGLLLEHHGAVTWGCDVLQALYRLESIEYNATVMMYTKMMGIERPMTNGQIDDLIKLRPAWGVTGGGRPVGRE
jgi:L-fuculose-phosphate aldolase